LVKVAAGWVLAYGLREVKELGFKVDGLARSAGVRFDPHLFGELDAGLPYEPVSGMCVSA
jgi:hypothetical protein